jgi:arylsulfatase A-like enzyme
MLMPKLIQKSLQGMFWGMIAWQVYAVFEYAAVTLAPLLMYRNMTIAAWQWKLSALLLFFYSLAGAILGALGGVLVSVIARSRVPGQEVFKTVGTLTLVTAFLANQFLRAREPASILLSIFVAIVLIWSLTSENRGRGLGLFANPWAIVPFLLGIGYINHETLTSRSVVLRSLVTLALAGLFWGASVWSSRIRQPRRTAGILRQASAVVGFAALLLLICGVFLNRDLQARGDGASSAESKPNVILLTLDTVRADHLSLYGYNRNTTSNLIKFAQSATLFTHVSAAGDMTLTSHASIFTGTYGSWNGIRSHVSSTSVHGQGVPMSDAYPTIAEILSKQGYSTAAVVANTGFLTPAWGFDRGFQLFYYPSALRMLPPDREYYLRYGARRLLTHFMDTSEFDMMFLRAEEINRQAYRFLSHAGNARRPFFLFLNYMDAHSPYVPPAPYDALFPGRDRSVPVGRYDQLFEELATNRGQMSPKELRNFVSRYDGGIAYMDAQIADLIARLKQLHLYDNTLIIITSDHGEALGERNLLGHGISADQDQVNVPLIVKYPGQGQKQVVESRVGHTDILPTILEVTGVALPKFMQGFGLRGGAGTANRRIVSESFPQAALMKLDPKFSRTERALFEENFKFIDSTAGKRELYDLAADPGESKDLCSAEGARCSRMQEELDAWVSGIPKHTGPARKIDSQTLERLRSLGYVGR